ncbi:hypothetical protein AAHA92_19057 [Salvia divinorum]|uniref:Uncharacterized protein n=1 Tax=Salvia divinorum TaxID=28513 RepID=A0ABD1H7C6_SALDI
MASQRMLFLVALVLAVALGCQGARIVCHTNEECSPCTTGEPLCADGLCTCTDNIGIHYVDYPGGRPLCHKLSDCPSNLCPIGVILCIDNLCTCDNS